MRTTTPNEPPSTGANAAKRQYRTRRERLRIVEESLQPGVSVAVVARRHVVNANQIFHWRKLYREGGLESGPTPAQLLPVRIAERPQSAIGCGAQTTGTIHIELGNARVRLEGTVDPGSLRLVLEHLGR